MFRSKYVLVFVICFYIAFAGTLLYRFGMRESREKYQQQLAQQQSEQMRLLNEANSRATSLSLELEEKLHRISELSGDTEELNGRIAELNEQIAGLSTDGNGLHPFAVPSTGTIGSQWSTFLGTYKDATHYGIDLWTTTENSGAISTNRGNPVYAACSGIVESFQTENGGVTISCDPVPDTFDVPARKVYTYYGHMANAVTKEQYIYLKPRQKVNKGQFIGFQGNLSMYTPGMRNVHLHFSIFTGYKESSGTQNPCAYIGGDCATVGKFFGTAVR